MAYKKKYSDAQKKSYRKGFLAGLFSSKGSKTKKKIYIPKSATPSQRHNILMRDDVDYLIAHRAALRSASHVEDEKQRKSAYEKLRNAYYKDIKNKTTYGVYLKTKFGDWFLKGSFISGEPYFSSLPFRHKTVAFFG